MEEAGVGPRVAATGWGQERWKNPKLVAVGDEGGPTEKTRPGAEVARGKKVGGWGRVWNIIHTQGIKYKYTIYI
jgi:hypothetical protein